MCEGHPDAAREEVLSKSKGVDGILWNIFHRVDAEALDCAGPQLKVISAYSAGLDFVDLNEIKRRKIAFGHLPHISNDAVADLAIGLTISAARRFHECYLKIVNNQWERFNPTWMLGLYSKYFFFLRRKTK